jgi:hypothetical protein
MTMTTTTEASRRTQLGAAAVIGLLVPFTAATVEPSRELAVALFCAIVVAARLVRIDFRIPLFPGIALLPAAAALNVAGASGVAPEIATVAAAMIIMAVLLALSMNAESREVLRSWSAAIRLQIEQRNTALFASAALLALVLAVVVSIAAFVLLDASLLAALVASAVALTAHSLGKSPTAALYGLALLTLGLATVAIPFGADGMRVDMGTMAFVYLFLASSFALAHALRNANDGATTTLS